MIEAEATTTVASLYSYETDTPSVCEFVFNVPLVLVEPQEVESPAVAEESDDIV